MEKPKQTFWPTQYTPCGDFPCGYIHINKAKVSKPLSATRTAGLVGKRHLPGPINHRTLNCSQIYFGIMSLKKYP